MRPSTIAQLALGLTVLGILAFVAKVAGLAFLLSILIVPFIVFGIYFLLVAARGDFDE